jgi:hypothetical protein
MHAQDQLRRRARWLALAVAGLLLAACNTAVHSPPGTGTPAFDPANATLIAGDALLVPRDLPGDSWVETPLEGFDDSAPNIPTRACQDLQRQRELQRQRGEGALAARAQSLLEAPGSTFGGSVETSVRIYRDVQTPADVLGYIRTEVESGVYAACFRDALAATLPATPDARLVIRAAELTRPAPTEDGVARAYQLTMYLANRQVQARLEVYSWRMSNAGVTVVIFGDAAIIDAAVTAAAVGTTDAALQPGR